MVGLIGFSVLFGLLLLVFISVVSCFFALILKHYRPSMENRDIVNWSAAPLPLICVLLLAVGFAVPMEVDENPQGRVVIGIALILIATVGWWLGWLSVNAFLKRKSQ